MLNLLLSLYVMPVHHSLIRSSNSILSDLQIFNWPSQRPITNISRMIPKKDNKICQKFLYQIFFNSKEVSS
jgi:hypothetical protein